MKLSWLLALIVMSTAIAAAQTAGPSSVSGIFNSELAGQTALASSATLSYAVSHFPYGGGFSTRTMFANSGTTDATVTVKFFNQAGASTMVPLDGQGMQATQQFVVHPNDVQVVGADLTQRNSSPITVVWATASSTAPLNVFSLFDYGPHPPAISGAVGAQSTPAAKSFRFPVSVGGPLGYEAGFAVANPNSTQTTVTVKVWNSDGSLKGSFQETLPANGQNSFTLTSKLSFDTSQLFNGSAAICAPQPVGLVTVGFEGGGAFFSTAVTNDPCP
jgi:hypothetical protein